MTFRMRIGTKQGFLILRSEPAPARPTVAVASSLSNVVAHWTSGTRVSPIWGLGGTKISTHRFPGSQTLIFLGPVSPARLFSELDLRRRPGNLHVWVGLGTYNLILRIENDSVGAKAIKQVAKWATGQNIPIEEWQVDDGVIRSWKATSLKTPRNDKIFRKLSKLAKNQYGNGLNIHAQEFLVLMSSALSRAGTVNERLHNDLVQVANEITDALQDVAGDPSGLLDVSAQLINLNAALSRFSSQAFSGISPILSTECHFWIHSLLGTGAANMALQKLVEFITVRLGNARLPGRFLGLKKVTTGVPSYEKLVTDYNFLWRDHIGGATFEEDDKPLQPIVTYFSGRDGYSSQLQTLSAPLTSIAQAHAFQTNLLTVTHEISHVFVEGVLGYLYPDPDDTNEIIALTQFVTSERAPANMFEAARKLLTEAVIAMEQLHHIDNIDNRAITAPQMLEMLTKWRREAKEIMVHVFDYLYFFQNSPDRYIQAIWSTWCAIPGISERIPEYIVRTLCAVSPRLLNLEPAERRATAREHFEKTLNDLISDGTLPTDYAAKALKKLNEKWTATRRGNPSIAQRYDTWLYLVRLTTAFMHSESAAADLFDDPHVTSKGKETSVKHSCIYDDLPLGNPIRFIRGHLTTSPREPESVWLLHNLAYCLRR